MSIKFNYKIINPQKIHKRNSVQKLKYSYHSYLKHFKIYNICNYKYTEFLDIYIRERILVRGYKFDFFFTRFHLGKFPLFFTKEIFCLKNMKNEITHESSSFQRLFYK